jgi:transcriptional regulator with XRE-family HTH domain
MSDYAKMTFVFGREMGARLRALRLLRKLSLRELASLMDRQGVGSYNQLGRLERGTVKRPSLNLIADYLRACGAGFENLQDLLGQYTSQPPAARQRADAAVADTLKTLPEPVRKAMLKWDKGVADAREAKAAAETGNKRPRVETDRQRVSRIIWSFIHANWNEEFEARLYVAMLKVKDKVPRSRRKDACRHGRRMFGILTKTYAKDKRRQAALAIAQTNARDDGFPDEVVSALLQAATETYTKLLLSGRLDWEPTEEQVFKAKGRAPKVEKAETRLEIEETAPSTEYNKTHAFVGSLVTSAVAARLDELKLDYHYVKRHYYLWLAELLPIAFEHGADSPEWKANVERWVPKLHDPAIAREAAAIAARAFNTWKVKLPATEPKTA